MTKAKVKFITRQEFFEEWTASHHEEMVEAWHYTKNLRLRQAPYAWGLRQRDCYGEYLDKFPLFRNWVEEMRDRWDENLGEWND